jgi:bifunctional non-homologous end joining protein LigD
VVAAIPCRSTVIDAELCLPGAGGAPDFRKLHDDMGRRRQHELVVYAFDLLHRDGNDLRPLPLIQRRQRLERLLAGAEISCLLLVEAFDDGEELHKATDRLHLEGIVSKRRSMPYCSGPCRDWRKIKTSAWRVANRER